MLGPLLHSTFRKPGRTSGGGCAFIHSAVNYHLRAACSETLASGHAAAAVAFPERALA